MVDSIIDNVVDKDEFSNKEIIKLENYDKLRSEYKNVIQNFNGICCVYDNQTAKNFPQKNIKTESTYIEKNFRDKKYISYGNRSEINEEFTHPGDISNPYDSSISGFDVTQGFYKIQVIGAGSGGISYKTSAKNVSSSGTAGGCCDLYVYFPINGHISGTIGKGSTGLKLNVYNNDILTPKGGDTEIYFNNNLIVKCYGGNEANIKEEQFNQKTGGLVTLGSYIEKIVLQKIGCGSDGGVRQDKTYVCDVDEKQPPFNEYGIGGCAQTSDSVQIAENGQNGYFKIESIQPSELGYLNEEIGIESNIIHTISNENEIRRNFKKALDKIYNKLIPITHLTKDTCNVIGEESNISTTAKKYSEIENNEYYKLVDVKKINNNPIGYFNKDDYLLVYDYDIENDVYILRKLELKDWQDFNVNSMSNENYFPFKNGDDIIYIKNIPNITSEINIFKLEDNKFIPDGVGTYYVYNIEENESVENDIIYNAYNNGYATVTLVGAGGGGGGGSGGKHWYKSGSGGGSGSYLKAIYKFQSGNTLRITVGKGGAGGNFTQRGSGTKGSDGTSTTFKINNTIVATAGAGGGGGGTTKNGSSGHTPCGNRGEYEFNNNDNLINVIESINGKGNTENNIIYREQNGMESVYIGTNYGAGGKGGNNGKDPYPNNGVAGINGYAKIELKREDELYYNNKIYTLYNDVNTFSSVIYNADYQYDLQKLNRLKEYVKTKDSWFDNDGYCQRSCQINCQTSVQKS